jgi:hypothetical protein
MEQDIAETEEMLARAKKPNKVKMRISCKDLLDMDTFSRSDPFAILWIKAEKDKVYRKLG